MNENKMSIEEIETLNNELSSNERKNKISLENEIKILTALKKACEVLEEL